MLYYYSIGPTRITYTALYRILFLSKIADFKSSFKCKKQECYSKSQGLHGQKSLLDIRRTSGVATGGGNWLWKMENSEIYHLGRK